MDSSTIPSHNLAITNPSGLGSPTPHQPPTQLALASSSPSSITAAQSSAPSASHLPCSLLCAAAAAAGATRLTASPSLSSQPASMPMPLPPPPLRVVYPPTCQHSPPRPAPFPHTLKHLPQQLGLPPVPPPLLSLLLPHTTPSARLDSHSINPPPAPFLTPHLPPLPPPATHTPQPLPPPPPPQSSTCASSPPTPCPEPGLSSPPSDSDSLLFP